MNDAQYKIFLYLLGVVFFEAIVLTRIKETPYDLLSILLWLIVLYLLSKVVQENAVANVNAIWCGMSAVIVTLYAAWKLKENPKTLAILGIGTVVLGVTLIEIS